MPAQVSKHPQAALMSVALAVLAIPTPAQAQGTSTKSVSLSEVGDHKTLLSRFHNRIDALSDRILTVEGTLRVLSETVLGGAVGKTTAQIIHRNETGSGFILEKAVYTLDGGTIFVQADPTGGLDEKEEFPLFRGALEAGTHAITVDMVYRGNSNLFTYLKGYRFKVQSKYDFKITEGKKNILKIVTFDKSGLDLTVEPKDKLSVRYDLELSEPDPLGGRPKPSTDKPAQAPEKPKSPSK